MLSDQPGPREYLKAILVGELGLSWRGNIKDLHISRTLTFRQSCIEIWPAHRTLMLTHYRISADLLIEEYGELDVQPHAMHCLWMMDQGRVRSPPAWLTTSLKGIGARRTECRATGCRRCFISAWMKIRSCGSPVAFVRS